jgi:UDP-N-acetylglucosamine--N-acetylmuramyl-(pentapeptide) pyrophosphoryl-undecaprenol N-acetylglucosamine transferase
MKIAITGGHLTPALAVISELKKIPGSKIIFIGRTTTIEGDKSPSAESIVVPNLGVKFYAISAGRLQRRPSVYTVPSIAKIPVGVLQALVILSREKPDVIVSFGSYVAFPVVLAGWVLGVKTITHEQTVKGGLTNKLLATLAKKIAVAWDESKEYFPKDKVVVVGNPIRKEILGVKRERTTRPVVFITGGNQGAHVINDAVSDVLGKLLSKYEVIHQTGGSEAYKDLEKLKASVSLLPKRLQNRYKVAKWFNTNELVRIFSKTSLIVSRSGANTVSEAAALGLPAIFIPIPWSGSDEQARNAKMLQDLGAAVVLPQNRLTPSRLLNTIDHVIKNHQFFKSKAKNAKRIVNKDAAKNLASEIRKLAEGDV